MRLVLATAVVLSLFTNPTMAEPTVKLHAAGSLKAAMSVFAPAGSPPNRLSIAADPGNG